MITYIGSLKVMDPKVYSFSLSCMKDEYKRREGVRVIRKV